MTLQGPFLSKDWIGANPDYTSSDWVMIGMPYDGTCSYRPGARFAPEEIRLASWGLEEYSPDIEREMSEISFFDAGELDIPFGNREKILEMIKNNVKSALDDGKKTIGIGGEHLVTLPEIEAYLTKYPDLCVIHFDAHTDLREEYLGVKLSHACVIKRCYDLVGDGRIHQFGIRSGMREEFAFAAKHTDMHKFSFEGLEAVADSLAGGNVYFTIDLDCLDPSCFPGTGTPEAEGVTFNDLRKALTFVCSRLNVVGCDVTELAPMLDNSDMSTAVACKVVRELLLALNI